jgi:hypothetical protein
METKVSRPKYFATVKTAGGVSMLSGKARKVLAEQDLSLSSARRNQLSLAKLEQMCKAQEFKSAAEREKAAYDAAVARLCGDDAAESRLCDKSQDARPDHSVDASNAATLPDRVQLTMTLGMSFQETGEEGSSKREAFKHDLANDLANASGLPAENFKITKLSAGSVVVDIDILPDPLGIAPAPCSAARDLEKQAGDPNSPLRSGKLTSQTKGIQILSTQPSTSAHPPPPTQPPIAGAQPARTHTQPHTHNRTMFVINGSIACLFVSVYACVRACACL